MSDSATATAIPREINLGLQKPVATPAYTRRFKSQAQNPESTAGTQATITLDTAQPGSFIDTLESYLSFKLTLSNSSTDKGYNVSFSSCGAHALIRAMRIYVQGVPIEEITEYNALAEWLHDLTGIPDYCDRSAKSRYLANTMMGDHFIYLPPKAVSASSDSTREIQIQLPLISGVLGTMAEKMFPSMLVAPGNCYIQLDLASAANALRIQEIDVSSLLVGTSPLLAAQGLAPEPVGRAASAANAVTAGSTNSRQNAVIDVNSTVTDAAIGHVNARDILVDRPYDAPFAVTDGSNVLSGNQGILTTEERIGGGMFNCASFSTSSKLRVSGSMAAADINTDVVTVATSVVPVIATTITDVTATPSSNAPVAAVFLGSGMNTTGSTMSGSGRKVNVTTPTVTYSINNLEFIGKQVVVGDDVARAIIERAAAGDISIHTQSYRQYPATIQLSSSWAYRVDPAMSVSSPGSVVGNAAIPAIKDGAPLVNMFQRYSPTSAQSLIIPAKISSANAIYHIFRNGNGVEDFQFDSLRRMTIGFTDGPGSSSGATAQLRIGNELIPQSPIQNASEVLEELLKAHHMDGFYGTCEKMGSIVAASQDCEWPVAASIASRRFLANTLSTDAIARTTGADESAVTSYTAGVNEAYGGIRYLRNDFNSQLLCPNPDSVTFKHPNFAAYAPLGAGRNFFATLGTTTATAAAAIPTTNTTVTSAHEFYKNSGFGSQIYKRFILDGATASGANDVTYALAESQRDYADRQIFFKKAVQRAFFGYADDRSDHQLKDPTKPNYMNPYRQHTGRYSTFMLGFDLDTFSNNTDTIRSGHYLGNNTVSLNLTGVEFIDNSPCNQALMTNARMDTYVLHDLRLSFQAGGIVQAFY